MKACVLEKIGQLTYKDIPDPVLNSGEVLLKIRACGICSSDIPRIFTTGTYSFPTIPGHEFSGEIVDVAPDVGTSYIGKKAVVFPLLPCRKCSSCEMGEYARCEHYNYFGSRCDGAFAEYLTVPVWNLVFFPGEISFEVAALCEPSSVAKHCVDAGEIHVGDTVAVIGTGTIGLIAAMWAKLAGAGRVVVVGRNEKKLEFAKAIGDFETLNSSIPKEQELFLQSLKNGGVDVALECVGSSEAIMSAINICRKGGHVVLTGNPSGDITLSKTTYWRILRGELKVTGTWNSSFNQEKNDWMTTVSFMQNDKLPVKPLITHKFALNQYKKALETIQNKDIFSMKVMFTM